MNVSLGKSWFPTMRLKIVLGVTVFRKLRSQLVGIATLVASLCLAPALAQGQTVTPYATGMGTIANLSFDTSGALFAGRFNNSGLSRVAAGGGVGTNFITRPSGQYAAVVGPDNGLYTVLTNGNVVRYAPGATVPDAAPYGTGTSTSSYTNLAFDASGRLYVIGNADANVFRIPAGGGAATVFGTVTGVPFGIAIDAGGRVYISLESGTSVLSIPSTGGAATVFGTGVSPQNYGIVVSAAGDVYVTSYGASAVFRIASGGGAATSFAAVPDGPTGITVRNGVLYVGSYNTGVVRQVSFPGPVVVPVPTMSEWAMILMGLVLASGAALFIQRRGMTA